MIRGKGKGPWTTERFPLGSFPILLSGPILGSDSDGFQDKKPIETMVITRYYLHFWGVFLQFFQVAQLWSSCVVGICRKLEIVWLSFLWLVGGWPTPLKNMSSSIGMMTFPIYGKTKVMFQTTNQLWSSWLVNFLLLQYDPFPSHQVRSPTISGNVLTLWPCGGRKNMEVKNPFVRPRHPRHKHSGALSDLLRSWKKKPVDWFFHHTKN